MKRYNYHFTLTAAISVLFGIILPLVLGVKDPTLIAITFSLVWFFYALVLLIIVFLVRPGLKIKLIRHKNPTIVRFELTDRQKE